MKLGIIGLGHVGLVNLCGFARMGFSVSGYDFPAVISSLKLGSIPFFEPGLDDLFESEFSKMFLTSDIGEFLNNADIIFLCVNTPYDTRNGMNISNVTETVKKIAEQANEWKLVVEKSTVPIGTHRELESIAQNNNLEFACCPEFLREGQAVQDFFNSDRIVIGSGTEKAKNILESIFSKFTGTKFYCSVESAELIKMASNAFLSMRISFINLISDLCEFYEADITEVAKGIGLDHRIGTDYFSAGIGFGGSCLPKDLSALGYIMRSHNINDQLLRAIHEINDLRLLHVVQLLGNLGLTKADKKLTIFGLTFKGDSDDCRDSQAIKLLGKLKELNVEVKCYDPLYQKKPSDTEGICEDPYLAAVDSECLIILNDMGCLKTLDFTRIAAAMQTPRLIDCKNILCKEDIIEFEYYSFGNYLKGKNIATNIDYFQMV